MSKPKRVECVIPLERVFFNLENPRHEPYETQAQVIEWLCSNEEVLQLARDIARYGISPLDRFGVQRDHDTDGKDATYIVIEGNRRLCALKLLTDPDLAPPEKKANFERHAATWTPIEDLPCVIFEDDSDRDLWLKRRHHGLAGGVGLKRWSSDQQARHSGVSSRNRIALVFLDYAEQQKLITAEGRKRKLTTVQRFLGNLVMRETLGLDTSDLDNICRTRTDDDFKLLSEQFISDMLADNPKVHSRRNKAYIDTYARSLSSLDGLNHERIEPEPLANDANKRKSNKTKRPKKPKPRKYLPSESKTEKALERLGNWKLQSIYRSICNIPLQENVPLLSIGTWAFFETLTVQAGRKSNTNFHSFLSPQLLQSYGLGNKQHINPLRDAIDRILKYGNTTKHHNTAAAFNGDQLANDFESLDELIRKVVEDAIAKKRN